MVEISNYQDGKVFKEIEYQIIIRREKIKTLELSIKKAYSLAGCNGPSGISGIDYARVTSSTPVAYIGLEDAVRMADQDEMQISILNDEIAQLRSRKRNLIRTLKNLEGIEEKIFYRRVVMKETQEAAADVIGLSTRHLQRIEGKMKKANVLFEI